MSQINLNHDTTSADASSQDAAPRIDVERFRGVPRRARLPEQMAAYIYFDDGGDANKPPGECPWYVYLVGPQTSDTVNFRVFIKAWGPGVRQDPYGSYESIAGEDATLTNKLSYIGLVNTDEDGMTFTVVPGVRTVYFALRIFEKGRNPYMPLDTIFLGQGQAQPSGNPLRTSRF